MTVRAFPISAWPWRGNPRPGAVLDVRFVPYLVGTSVNPKVAEIGTRASGVFFVRQKGAKAPAYAGASTGRLREAIYRHFASCASFYDPAAWEVAWAEKPPAEAKALKAKAGVRRATVPRLPRSAAAESSRRMTAAAKKREAKAKAKSPRKPRKAKPVASAPLSAPVPVAARRSTVPPPPKETKAVAKAPTQARKPESLPPAEAPKRSLSDVTVSNAETFELTTESARKMLEERISGKSALDAADEFLRAAYAFKGRAFREIETTGVLDFSAAEQAIVAADNACALASEYGAQGELRLRHNSVIASAEGIFRDLRAKSELEREDWATLLRTTLWDPRFFAVMARTSAEWEAFRAMPTLILRGGLDSVCAIASAQRPGPGGFSIWDFRLGLVRGSAIDIVTTIEVPSGGRWRVAPGADPNMSDDVKRAVDAFVWKEFRASQLRAEIESAQKEQAKATPQRVPHDPEAWESWSAKERVQRLLASAQRYEHSIEYATDDDEVRAFNLVYAELAIEDADEAERLAYLTLPRSESPPVESEVRRRLSRIRTLGTRDANAWGDEGHDPRFVALLAKDRNAFLAGLARPYKLIRKREPRLVARVVSEARTPAGVRWDIQVGMLAGDGILRVLATYRATYFRGDITHKLEKAESAVPPIVDDAIEKWVRALGRAEGMFEFAQRGGYSRPRKNPAARAPSRRANAGKAPARKSAPKSVRSVKLGGRWPSTLTGDGSRAA